MPSPTVYRTRWRQRISAGRCLSEKRRALMSDWGRFIDQAALPERG